MLRCRIGFIVANRYGLCSAGAPPCFLRVGL
jgi:hypothetical protein